MITIAQIGCGYWGPNLLRNFSSLPACHVKYVVDLNQDRLEYVRKNYPASQAVTDLRTAVADPAVQAFVIATPAASHFSLARELLEAGRHVFVEKPLAMSSEEARILDATAREKGLVLMVGHTFLYNPAVLHLKQIIDSGELGRIYYGYSQRLNLGVVRSDINAFWNLAPHDVSIFNFLFGAQPTAVSANGKAYLQPGVEDVVFANLEYAGNIQVNIHVSWLDPNKIRKVTLVGSKKMAVYDDMADDKIEIFDKGIDTPEAALNPLPFDPPPSAQNLIYRCGAVSRPSLPKAEPLRETVADFIDAIKNGRPARSDGTSGRTVVAVLEAVSRSLRENSRRIDLPA